MILVTSESSGVTPSGQPIRFCESKSFSKNCRGGISVSFTLRGSSLARPASTSILMSSRPGPPSFQFTFFMPLFLKETGKVAASEWIVQY